MTARHSSRRDFLKAGTAAASAAAVWHVAGPARAQDRAATADSPMQRVNFACIGVDGKGASDSRNAAGLSQIVALCDVDKRKLNGAKAKLKEFAPDADTYQDFREMLAERKDDIDAVTISTPDHTHAPAAVMALALGKHTFCQKPLTWSMEEARVLRNLADETGLCTQMGNQGTAADGLREGVEIIRSGALGPVREVHVWTNRPVWPQGDGLPRNEDGTLREDPVPPPLDWDLWIGPAPMRAFVEDVYHPFKWRGWLDFGTGALGDMACHTANMAVMALNLFDAETAVAEHTPIVEGQFPAGSRITFQFAEREGATGETLPACKLYWYDGGNTPDKAMLEGLKMSSSGSLVVGDQGKLYSPNDYGEVYNLLPVKKFVDYKKPDPVLPRSPGHFDEFVEAIRKNDPELALSNFDYAARLTETILLGNVALKAGGPVEWDAASMKITNMPDGRQFIGREYRDGWTIDPQKARAMA